MAEPLHVACATSREYLPHAAAMLHSLLTVPGGDRVHVHYLHGPRMPPEDREQLGRDGRGLGGEISLHEVPDEEVAGLRTRGFDDADLVPDPPARAAARSSTGSSTSTPT